MIEGSILIPLAGNSGETFDTVHHDAFESYARSRFGGLTRLQGTPVGSWTNPAGTTYVDRFVIYLVALGSITEGGKLAEVIDFAKAHYAQEGVYFRYLGLAEIR